MKPDNHEELMRIAAFPPIRRKLALQGLDGIDLSPLLVGNWIADYNQFLLPVIEHRVQAREWADKHVNEVLTRLESFLARLSDARMRTSEAGTQSDLNDLATFLDRLYDDLTAAIVRLTTHLTSALDNRSHGGVTQPLPIEASLEEVTEYLRVLLEQIAQLPERARARTRDLFRHLAAHLTLRSMLRQLEDGTVIRLIHEEITRILDDLMPRNATSVTPLDRVVRAWVITKGYFKFVHPAPGQDRTRMNPEAYFRIANAQLRVSFCHDHCDRPPVGRRGDDTLFDERGLDRLQPDVYEYLREDRQLISGRLYELEKEWAIPCFDTHTAAIADDSCVWYAGLAKLGETLHTIEDFYAHTNFVEHARVALEAQGIEEHISEHDVQQRTLRLQRLTSPSAPASAPEPHIVSGVFEGRDTALAVLEFVLDWLGYEPTYPDRTGAELWNNLTDVTSRPVDYLMRRFWEAAALINPAEAFTDPTNTVAQEVEQIWRKYNPQPFQSPVPLSDDMAKRILKTTGLAVDDVSTRDFQSIVANLRSLSLVFIRGRLLFRYLTLALDLLKLHMAIRLPHTRRREMLFDLLDDHIKDYIVEGLAQAAFTQVVDRIAEWINAGRFGSHALLAKDSEGATYFSDAMKLAVFVDSYVVALLVRSHRGPKSDRIKVVRWQDVIDYFLAHPLAQHHVSQQRSVESVVTLAIRITRPGGETASQIASRFSASSRIPRDAARRYPRFDWKVIMDWNYGTAGSSAAASISSTPLGAQTTFGAGVQVLVPYQVLGYSEPYIEITAGDWWAPVLQNTELFRVVKAYEDWENDPERYPFAVPLRPSIREFSLEQAVGEIDSQLTPLQQLRRLRIRNELKARGVHDSSIERARSICDH